LILDVVVVQIACPIFDVVATTTECDAYFVLDCDSPRVSEFSTKPQFLETNETKLNNVDKGGCKVNKHVEFWANNSFDD
jgi:hypothetical protein